MSDKTRNIYSFEDVRRASLREHAPSSLRHHESRRPSGTEHRSRTDSRRDGYISARRSSASMVQSGFERQSYATARTDRPQRNRLDEAVAGTSRVSRRQRGENQIARSAMGAQQSTYSSARAASSRFSGCESDARMGRGANNRPSWLSEDDFEPEAYNTPRPALESEEESEPKGKLASILAERKKAKMEKRFDSQYGGSSAPGEGGARAAVYNCKMGSKQRQAARMQEGANPQAMGKGRRKRASLATSNVLSTFVAAMVVVVFSIGFLYPAARDYYQASRNLARERLEQETVTNRNATIQSRIDALETDAGIETVAHQQYGWVRPGENAVNVQGVATPDGSANIAVNVQTVDIDYPETWYSGVLDPIFGVE